MEKNHLPSFNFLPLQLLRTSAECSEPCAEELLALGANHAIAKSDGTMAVHRAASSARAEGPPSCDASKSAANAVRLLIQASAEGGGESTMDAPSSAGTPFLMACSRGGEAVYPRERSLPNQTKAPRYGEYEKLVSADASEFSQPNKEKQRTL